MKTIQLKLYDKKAETFRISDQETIQDIACKLLLPYPVFAARRNHQNSSLTTVPAQGDLIELLDIRDSYAHQIYQESLCLLYTKAVHDVLGEVSVIIANSLGKGLFTQIKGQKIASNTVRKIENTMRKWVKEALPFTDNLLTYQQAILTSQRLGMKNDNNLLSSLEEKPSVHLIGCGKEKFFYTHSLVPDASYLSIFRLKPYKTGILLRFPHPFSPNTLPIFCPQELLYKAFSRETLWEKNIGISYAIDLNEKNIRNEMDSLILLAEALHEKEIGIIAERIRRQKKRLILIAGPSSSGKTSFAKRLAIQLRVRGINSLYLGTDDYFKNRDETPLLENGERDYESINALDVHLFNTHIHDLLAGNRVTLPRYDFYAGKKVYGERQEQLEKNQPIIIEGIHALNPILTSALAKQDKYHIYISPLTQLNIEPQKRVSTSDARLLRRILRDHRTRGYSPEETIRSWKNVRKGEETFIFPYSDQADYFFNSSTIYELAVLKGQVSPLLQDISSHSDVYGEAQRLLSFLAFFRTYTSFEAIPSHSILREFLGGSVLVS